jgi:hypothetical protein
MSGVILLDRPAPAGLGVLSSTIYEVECWDNFVRNKAGEIIRKRRRPKLRWKDRFHNIVVTTGLNKLLDATFKNGLTTPAWYVGLKGTGTMVAGDTMASHAGWSEIVPYSDSTRPAFTPGTISSGAVDNSASKAVFNINSGTTVYGCFLSDNSTKSGTTGTLYGGGDFGSSRAVVNGDTLNVTVTLTQTSA